MGHSVGKWEGDTLVVDTIGFNGKSSIADTIPAAAAFPSTEKLHLTSRFRRPDLGHLEMDVTFDDPGTFTKPWTMKTVSDLAEGEEVQEIICTENNQDVEHLVGKISGFANSRAESLGMREVSDKNDNELFDCGPFAFRNGCVRTKNS